MLVCTGVDALAYMGRSHVRAQAWLRVRAWGLGHVPEVDFRCVPQSLSLFLRQSLSLNQDFANSAKLVGEVALASLCLPPSMGLQVHAGYLARVLMLHGSV